MSKHNQISGLQPSRPRPGAVYHWKPSPRLRRMGWQNLKLGTDWKAARIAAMARNDEVEAALAAAGEAAPGAAPRRMPVRPRFRDLVEAYKRDPAFLDLKPRSQLEYRSRLGTLLAWAEDGATPLDQLDRAMIVDLRNALVADGRKHRTAALLRVLRLLLNFGAGQGWLAPGLASGIDIPEAPARRRVLALADVEAMIARARAEGAGRLALALTLGFWTFQREGDLLALNRFAWREMTDMSPFARGVLAAGGDGRVMGFRLQQGKTGTWVDLALPHALRLEVEAEWARQSAGERALGLLLPDPAADAAAPRPWPAWAYQRAFRALAEGGGIADVQFRDMRRSGMVFFGGHGVELQFITAMSGHAVLGRKTILDTYMPGNSRFAAEGMAIAWSRHLAAVEQATKADGAGAAV